MAVIQHGARMGAARPGGRSRRARPELLLAGLAALLVVSCASPEIPEVDRGVAVTQFQDLPVPDGMVLRDEQHESHSRQVGDYRFGRFVYLGRRPVDEVREELVAKMPRHAWQLTESRKVAPEHELLRFERGVYVAECSIEREDTSTWLRIDLRTR